MLIFHIPQIIVQLSRISVVEYNLLGHIVYFLMTLLGDKVWSVTKKLLKFEKLLYFVKTKDFKTLLNQGLDIQKM